MKAAPSPVVAFVIPARDEAGIIVELLRSIAMQAGAFAHEVVVVDNGSTDDTAHVARSAGAVVLESDAPTIAAARNAGIAATTAGVLVFVDADMMLAPGWGRSIGETIAELAADPFQIVGSRGRPDNLDTFVRAYWCARLLDVSSGYVASGHLVTTRALLERLDGFDATRRTAEDHDLCARARALGFSIRRIPALEVIDRGNPRTMVEFVRRERWHGIDDVKDLDSFAGSPTAWLAAANLVGFVLAAVATAAGSGIALPLYLMTGLGAALLLTLRKFGIASLRVTCATVVIFYCYIWGRSLSIPAALSRRVASVRGFRR